MEALELIKRIEELDYNNPEADTVVTYYEQACHDIIELIKQMEKERWNRLQFKTADVDGESDW